MPKSTKHPQTPIWEAFDSDELKQVWEDWVKFRAEKNQIEKKKFLPYVPTGLKTTITKLRKLAGGNEKIMIAIIQQSMTGKGWEGFWPLKEHVSIKDEVKQLTDNMTNLAVHAPPPKPVQGTLDLTNWKDIWEERKEDALSRPIDRMILGDGLINWVWENEPDLDTSPEAMRKYMITGKAVHERHLLESMTPQNKALHRDMQREGWEKDIFLFQAVEKKAKIVAIKRLLYIHKEQSQF